MLSNPSVGDLMDKVGNRYEVALAVATRARQIAKKRIADESDDISDTVDIASKEIAEGKIRIKQIDTKEEEKEWEERS